MTTLDIVLILLAGIGPLLALVRAVRAPDSLVLVACGVALAFIPGARSLQIDPKLLLGLTLPPLIYAATVRLSWHLLRHTWHTGVMVGLATSALTAGAVVLAARWLLPGLSWTGAGFLGVVVALFDTRLFQEAECRSLVPRAVADALKAREVAARLVPLCLLAVLEGTMEDGPPTLAGALGGQAWALAGGTVAGFAIGRAVVWLRARVDPSPVEVAVSLATPFLCALAARWLGLSLAISVIVAALTVSTAQIDRRTGAPLSASETRMSSAAFWEEINLLLSSILFLLAGRALPEALREMGDTSVWRVAAAGAALLALATALQAAVAAASTLLRPIADAVEGRPGGRARAAGVMAWASTRSVIGLVAALSIPVTGPDGQPYAERGLLLVVACAVILGSVLLQGLTLRAAVRAAALADKGGDEREEQKAHTVLDGSGHEGGDPGQSAENGHDAERRRLIALRKDDAIGDEVLRRLLQEVDVRSRAADTDAQATKRSAKVDG